MSDLDEIGALGETDPPADGAAVLDEVLATLKRYVVFATDESAHAVTLYVAAAYAVSEANVARG